MRRQYVFIFFLITAILFTVTTIAICKTEAPPMLTDARQNVAAELDRMDASLKQTARILGTTGLTGDAARASLNQLCANFDYAVDCAAVDMNGKMVTIEPAPFQAFEGKDISGQAQVRRIIKTGKPVLSSVFRAVEGFPAVDAEYPVVTPAGKRIGSVSILIHPEKLIGNVLVPLIAGTPLDVWVMEKSGRILYDRDEMQIGLNLFAATLYKPYKGLLRLGRRIAANPEGSGVYKFRSDTSPEILQKKAFWKSVSLYGTEWRLVAIHVEQKGPTGILVPAKTMKRKLEALASSRILLQALSAGDKIKGMKLFKEFYDDTPGIYAVQWVDEKGMNRFGYPPTNSLIDYDFNALRGTDAQNTLKIIAEKKPAAHEGLLMEGRTGIFIFEPVFDQERYLGMVYYIRLAEQQMKR